MCSNKSQRISDFAAVESPFDTFSPGLRLVALMMIFTLIKLFWIMTSRAVGVFRTFTTRHAVSVFLWKFLIVGTTQWSYTTNSSGMISCWRIWIWENLTFTFTQPPTTAKCHQQHHHKCWKLKPLKFYGFWISFFLTFASSFYCIKDSNYKIFME